MKDPIFYNKNGELSSYGLACGYVEKRRNKTLWKEMYREHNVYNVRTGKVSEQYGVWKSFDKYELTRARKYYRSIKIK